MFEREVNEIHKSINDYLFLMRDNMVVGNINHLTGNYESFKAHVHNLDVIVNKIIEYHLHCEKAAKEV